MAPPLAPLWQEVTETPTPSPSPTPTPSPTPEPTSTPPPIEFPDFGGILDGWGDNFLEQLGQVLTDWFNAWWETQGPGLIGEAIASIFGLLAQALWSVAGDFLGGSNLFTQVPPAWSYELAPVLTMRSRLEPLGGALLTLALVVALLWIGLGTLWGKPFGRVLSSLPTWLLLSGAILLAPDLQRWWVDFSNSASAALLDPATGLPGLGAILDPELAAELGMVVVVYLGYGLWFFVRRIKVLVLAVLCIAIAPIAVAAGAFPIPHAQRFFHWWLATFLACTFVQVPQAVCLGIGAAMLAEAVAGNGYDTPMEGMVSALMGVGSIAAAGELPGLLLGSLVRAGVGGTSVVNTALQMGTILAGGAMAGAVARAGAATVTPAAVAAAPTMAAGAGQATVVQSGYVRSLLAGAPRLLLPPPQP